MLRLSLEGFDVPRAGRAVCAAVCAEFSCPGEAADRVLPLPIPLRREAVGTLPVTAVQEQKESKWEPPPQHDTFESTGSGISHCTNR